MLRLNKKKEPTGFTCAINKKSKMRSLECKMTKDAYDIPFPANHAVKFNLTFSSTRLYRYGNITSQTDIKFNIRAET